MSGPSRLKGEKDRGGSAHCFVNIFFWQRDRRKGGEERREGINILWRRLAASFVAYGMRQWFCGGVSLALLGNRYKQSIKCNVEGAWRSFEPASAVAAHGLLSSFVSSSETGEKKKERIPCFITRCLANYLSRCQCLGRCSSPTRTESLRFQRGSRCHISMRVLLVARLSTF